MTFIDKIDQIDKKWMLFFNSFHADWLDPIMLFISAKYTWIPFYVLLLGLLVYKYKKKVWLYLIALILTIAAADQFASGLCKPYFKRLRPCHQVELKEKLHILDHGAGQYGFISSHAANSFAVAIFLGLAFGGGWYLRGLLLWASLVTYSRIYVGVHFPLDLILGAIAGSMIGFWFYYWLEKALKIYNLK